MGYLEWLVIGGGALIIGFIVGLVLVRYTNIVDRISKHERYKQKIINNPKLLLEKLEENGDIVDMGKKVKLSIVEKDGKKEIVVTMGEDIEQLEKKIT